MAGNDSLVQAVARIYVQYTINFRGSGSSSPISLLDRENPKAAEEVFQKLDKDKQLDSAKVVGCSMDVSVATQEDAPERPH